MENLLLSGILKKAEVSAPPQHLDSGLLIATQGKLHTEGIRPVQNVRLDMEQLPPGRYILGISGDLFSGTARWEFSGE